MGLLSLLRNMFYEQELAELVKEERCCIRENYDYLLAFNDGSISNPFVINNELVSIAKQHKNIGSEYARAKSLFEWFSRNIRYKNARRYKNAIKVLETKTGICGDEAVLYITMARCCGLEANYVSVRKDHKGKKVCHACAGVNINSEWLLVDPAYETFDVKHKKYKIISDEDVRQKFEIWMK